MYNQGEHVMNFSSSSLMNVETKINICNRIEWGIVCVNNELLESEFENQKFHEIPL